MIGRRGMGDVEAARFRHVAAGAVIVLASLQAVARRKAATAAQRDTPGNDPGSRPPFRGGGEMMWVVAGNASEPTSGWRGSNCSRASVRPGRQNGYRPGPAVARTRSKSDEMAARADSRHCAAHAQDPGLAGQVALARRHPKRRRQIGGIDDRHVLAVDHRGTSTWSSPGP